MYLCHKYCNLHVTRGSKKSTNVSIGFQSSRMLVDRNNLRATKFLFLMTVQNRPTFRIYVLKQGKKVNVSLRAF